MAGAVAACGGCAAVIARDCDSSVREPSTRHRNSDSALAPAGPRATASAVLVHARAGV
jgi:hypothetical protein